MKQREVEAALEQKVRYEIPSDRAVPLSVNRGQPAVIAEAGSDFAKAVVQMAKTVADGEQKKQPSRKFLPSLAKA